MYSRTSDFHVLRTMKKGKGKHTYFGSERFHVPCMVSNYMSMHAKVLHILDLPSALIS